MVRKSGWKVGGKKCAVMIGDAYWSGRFNIAVEYWE
jgi:hypothetical protein